MGEVLGVADDALGHHGGQEDPGPVEHRAGARVRSRRKSIARVSTTRTMTISSGSGPCRPGRRGAAWLPSPRRGGRPRWWPCPAAMARTRTPSMTAAEPRRAAHLHDGVPGPGPAGPQGQDDGDGEQGDAHHEVGHDDVGVELGVDDDPPRTASPRIPPMRPADEPGEVAPAGQAPQAASRATAASDAEGHHHQAVANRGRMERERRGEVVPRAGGPVGAAEPRVGEADGRPRDDVEHDDPSATWAMRRKARGPTPGSAPADMVPAGPTPPPGARPVGAGCFVRRVAAVGSPPMTSLSAHRPRAVGRAGARSAATWPSPSPGSSSCSLVTTLPTMLVARRGVPSLAAHGGHPGGRGPGGRRGQRHQHGGGPGHRQG